MAWLLCGALVVFFGIAWRAWEPCFAISRSQERTADLRRELRERRVQEAELRYRLAAATTAAGAERIAVDRGIGYAGTVALRPVWRQSRQGDGERGLYQRTEDWARSWLGKRLGGVPRPGACDDGTEPAKRSLTMR